MTTSTQVGNEKLKTLIRGAVSMTGSYDPDDVLPAIEERLTVAECRFAEGFLSWVDSTGQQFGSATYDERVREYEEAYAEACS